MYGNSKCTCELHSSQSILGEVWVTAPSPLPGKEVKINAIIVHVNIEKAPNGDMRKKNGRKIK